VFSLHLQRGEKKKKRRGRKKKKEEIIGLREVSHESSSRNTIPSRMEEGKRGKKKKKGEEEAAPKASRLLVFAEVNLADRERGERKGRRGGEEKRERDATISSSATFLSTV